MENIKNIIFDFGGVIFDVSYKNVTDNFVKFGADRLSTLYSKAFQTDFIDLYEEGKISSADFRNEVRNLARFPLTDEQIDFAWNSILVGIPDKRVEFLLELKKKYRLFLFSNTNAIVCDEVTRYLNEKFGFDFFATVFDAAYFSHTLHIRKPKAEGFRHILREQKLDISETLFIDDSPQHIEGARKAGLNAYHLADGQTIESLNIF